MSWNYFDEGVPQKCCHGINFTNVDLFLLFGSFSFDAILLSCYLYLLSYLYFPISIMLCSIQSFSFVFVLIHHVPIISYSSCFVLYFLTFTLLCPLFFIVSHFVVIVVSFISPFTFSFLFIVFRVTDER